MARDVIHIEVSGLLVALPTPFTADHTLDLMGYQRIAKRAIQGGASGLVPLGATGEASALDEVERDVLLQAALQEAGGRPVLAGTGSNSTRQTIAWTRRAQQLGARGALVVTPYFNQPTQGGLVAHYRAVAEAVPGFPIVVQNVPSRTGVNLEPATLCSLWRIPEVAGVMEGSRNLAQLRQIARTLPSRKLLLAADDDLAAESIALGAQGLVSVLGNAYPELAVDLVRAALAGRTAEAVSLQALLSPLTDALSFETNPIPLKALLKRLGLCGDHVRLPLLPAAPGTRSILSAAMHRTHVA